MSNAWDRAKELAEKHAQAGGIFVRLANDGDKVVGALCGEPHTREVVWTGSAYEPFDAANPEHADKRAALRVTINIFVPAENKVKVIEGGTAWFKDILKVREKYGLETWLFEIERHGEANSTKTKYTILPETQIDAAMRARIDAAELHDLANLGTGEDDESEPSAKERAAAKGAATKASAPKANPQVAAKPPPATAAASGPELVSDKAAGEIMGELRRVPKSDLELFLSRFGVTRIRDVKAVDEATARAFVADLVAKYAPKAASEPPREVDPFG